MDVALEAVHAAESIILRYYERDFTVDTKEDSSPVTIADREAESVVRRVVLEKFPDHVVYGEEGEKVVGQQGQYTWIIDPIDGTKNFVRGIPLFGTLLALMIDGEVILGVSNMPAMGELLYAERGEGAILNGEAVHVSKVEELADAYLSHGTVKYFTRDGYRDNLLTLSERVRSARGIGDCWPYHLLAQGKIDIFTEFGMKIWDIAPFLCIIPEAGGLLTQVDGTPADMGARGVLVTNGRLHPKALDAFAS